MSRPPAHTILVVDDEPASVRAIERALAADYPVVTAPGGTQALAALAAQPVTLMVVDQRMPDMSGTELLARTAALHPEVVRVLLTGYTDVDTLIDAINAGHIYYYLTKPWEPPELRLVVQRGLERYDATAERRRLIDDLRDACARLRRELDRRARLLTMAAHELGTPLHVLSNALAVLAEAELAEVPRGWLETARRSAGWLARGLAQMAQHARCQSSLSLCFRSLDLQALLGELQATYEPIARARGLRFAVEVPNEVRGLTGDVVWLERALSNLLSNAVRFTPAGGHITLAAAVTADAVDITVEDSGIGIDAGLLAEVFEPFSVAGGDVALHTSGRFEFGSRGLGLGLAIAKAVIERHGGSIGVSSVPGSGTCFTVSLPRRPHAPPAADADR